VTLTHSASRHTDGTTSSPNGAGPSSTEPSGVSAVLPNGDGLPGSRNDQAGKVAKAPARRREATATGSVAFVGTGPGDPGLLTVRAVELIAAADVVVLDQLLREGDVVHLTRPDVELLDATFGQDGAPLTQAARGKLVTRAARGGRNVVRLLDGDPAMFSGLADEARACRKVQLPFEVVPGVSAATAVPAYAGIPLTTRTTRAVHVITPHDVKVDWSRSAGADVTVVLHGPPSVIGAALTSLASAGRAGGTPVAITRGGTSTDQATVTSTLAQAPDALAEPGALAAERTLLVVVGDPVGLREELSWFETKPLFGWRVLVPRTKDQAGATTDRLAVFGAVSQVVPTISVEPPRTPQQMERAIKGLVTGRYEWIGFTSVNAVRAVRERFEEFGLDARAFSGLKVAAVGGVTAAALRDWGIEADLVPDGEQSASGLLAEWPPFDNVLDPINRVFLPRADIATDTLVAGLQELGWEVDDVTAYRTVRAAPPAAEVRESIKTGKFDAVVFTSSSTVRNLVGIAGKPHQSTVVACIGPATAKTAQEHGLRVDVLAAEATTTSLVDGLAEFGAGLRLAAVESGEPMVRPSQRKAAARRKAR
jgi:uroporphyrinogen III methyltransferase / synthase